MSLALTGMEVAAALTDKAHSVSIIGIETVPFKKALGEKVGKAIMKVKTFAGNLELFQKYCTVECGTFLLSVQSLLCLFLLLNALCFALGAV